MNILLLSESLSLKFQSAMNHEFNHFICLFVIIKGITKIILGLLKTNSNMMAFERDYNFHFAFKI